MIKIFVDQGHNPQNPNAGAEANGVREQDVTYEVGVRLAELLRANPNFEVRLSRNTPTEQLGTSNATSLAARVNAANGWPADYFISLHCNASTNTTASGSEVYVYSETSPAFPLGEAILVGLQNATGLRNRGMFIRPRPCTCCADQHARPAGGNGLSDQSGGRPPAVHRPAELRPGHLQRHAVLFSADIIPRKLHTLLPE